MCTYTCIAGTRPFQCQYCNRSFTQRSTLNKHIKSIHYVRADDSLNSLKPNTDNNSPGQTVQFASNVQKVVQIPVLDEKQISLMEMASVPVVGNETTHVVSQQQLTAESVLQAVFNS